MANEIRMDVVVRDKGAERTLRGIAGQADKAGGEFRELGADAEFLDRRIEEVDRSVKELIRDLDRTGDIDLIKGIRTGRRELRMLEGFRKELRVTNDEFSSAAAGVGIAFGSSFSKGAATALARGGPAVIGGVVALGAAITPMLGGIVSGAVLGGVGVGGIIGGLVGAAQDQRVRTAASEFGERAMGLLAFTGEPFVQPVIHAFDQLEGSLSRLAVPLREGFAGLAPVLTPLVDGITGLAESALPGLLKGFEASKPVIRALANELPEIGEAFGDFITDLSEESDGAVLGIIALSEAIQGLLRIAGTTFRELSRTFEDWVRFTAMATGGLEDVFGAASLLSPPMALFADQMARSNDNAEEMLAKLDAAGDASGDFAGSLGAIGDSASDAARHVERLQTAMDELFGIQMSLDRATLRFEQSFDDLIEEIGDGRKTLDATVEAGRENRGAILDQIDAIKALRDANIDNNLTIDSANSIYSRQIEQLRNTLHQMGLNKQIVDELIDAYAKIPTDILTKVRIRGNTALIERLGGTKSVRTSVGDLPFGGGITQRAHGGPVGRGRLYLIGENGPELLSTGGNSGMVHSAERTKQALAGGGSQPVTVNVTLAPGSGLNPLGAAIWAEVQRNVQVIGGGSSTLALDTPNGGPL